MNQVYNQPMPIEPQPNALKSSPMKPYTTHTFSINKNTLNKSGKPAASAGPPKLSAVQWEDEQTYCFQVEINNVIVARRKDNDDINGTKLLNAVGMTRGKRDGILKTEKHRFVVKSGAMVLKGVWLPLRRAKELAVEFNIFDQLYPLFEANIEAFYYSPGLEGTAHAIDLELSSTSWLNLTNSMSTSETILSPDQLMHNLRPNQVYYDQEPWSKALTASNFPIYTSANPDSLSYTSENSTTLPYTSLSYLTCPTSEMPYSTNTSESIPLQSYGTTNYTQNVGFQQFASTPTHRHRARYSYPGPYDIGFKTTQAAHNHKYKPNPNDFKLSVQKTQEWMGQQDGSMVQSPSYNHVKPFDYKNQCTEPYPQMSDPMTYVQSDNLS